MRNKIFVRTLILCALVTALFGSVYADVTIEEHRDYKFLNIESNNVLSVLSDDKTANLNYDYTTSTGELRVLEDQTLDTQQFYFIKSGETDYYLMSRAGNTMYLVSVLADEKAEEGNRIVIKDGMANNKDIQKWQIVDVDGQSIALVSKSNPNLAITFVGFEDKLRLMPYTGEPSQLFGYEAVEKEIAERGGRGAHVTLTRQQSEPQVVNTNITYIEEEELATIVEQAEAESNSPARMDNWFNDMESYISAQRGIDFDGWYGAQCVDLSYQYTHYLFHPGEDNYAFRKSIDGGNGGEIFDRGNSEYYEKIKYYPGFVAQKGDLVVFQYNLARGWGRWGHVAVVESATEDALNVITQNGSAGQYVKRSVYDYSTYAAYNYSEIVGFLRPRVEKIAD